MDLGVLAVTGLCYWWLACNLLFSPSGIHAMTTRLYLYVLHCKGLGPGEGQSFVHENHHLSLGLVSFEELSITRLDRFDHPPLHPQSHQWNRKPWAIVWWVLRAYRIPQFTRCGHHTSINGHERRWPLSKVFYHLHVLQHEDGCKRAFFMKVEESRQVLCRIAHSAHVITCYTYRGIDWIVVSPRNSSSNWVHFSLKSSLSELWIITTH